MKKIFLPILFLTMFASLSSKGFQFFNETGKRIKVDIEAKKYGGKIENKSVVLREGQVYTRKNFEEIETLTVTTIKGSVGLFASKEEVAVIEAEEIFSETWKKNIDTKQDKIRKISFSINNNNLKHKLSWIDDPVNSGTE